MVKRLSRKELYELVWSEPMKNLSVRFGISDVALKKTCARAAIPTPDRSYWAKREAGKSTPQQTLSERPPGMDEEVVVGGGGNYWYQQWSNDELLALLPPHQYFRNQSKPCVSVLLRSSETSRYGVRFTTGTLQSIAS